MNKNEILILFVLCILLIVVINQIIKTSVKEKFYQTSRNRRIRHGHGDGRSSGHGHAHPFPHDECSSDEYIRLIGDIHLNFNRDVFPRSQRHFRQNRIHIVHPENPCCLRTCINDFTYTPDNVDPDNQLEVANIGKYKEYINKHLFFASKCNMCLDNFYVALKRLGSETECDETDTSPNRGRSGCVKQI